MKHRYLLAGVLGAVAISAGHLGAEPVSFEWGKAESIDLTELHEAIETAAEEDASFGDQALSLAYQSAVFLVTGRLDASEIGSSQRVDLAFGKRAEDGRRAATVSVEFVGKNKQGAFHGERYLVKLSRDLPAAWEVQVISRSEGKRAPIALVAPESRKFADFLKLARAQTETGPVAFEHDEFQKPMRFDREEADEVSPIDPLVVRLEGEAITVDEIAIPLGDFSKRIAEYVAQVELVGEQPLLMIKSLDGVSFELGLRVLCDISKAGLHEIVLPREIPPHGPGRGITLM